MRQPLKYAILALLVVLGGPGRAQEETPQPRRIELTARKFEFSPAQITVKAGETVELVASSLDSEHAFECKALGIRTVRLPHGVSKIISFTAMQAGTYEFQCSHYCGSGHRRMKGRIIVS